MIAVQKIFGLPSDAPGLSNIKLAQSDSKELGLNTEKKYLNTDFFRKYNNGIKQPATGVPMQEYIFPAGKCLHLSAERFIPGTPFPTVRIGESHSVYRMAHRTDQSENSLPYSGGWALCVKD